MATTIERHDLCSADCLVFVALSGGADSVALLRAICVLGYRVVALHCNFALRGSESEGDEVFVRELCNTLGVELRVQRYDTQRYAEEHKLSIEMAARELRYAWFVRELDSCSSQAVVAIAHNSDDQIETLLLNLSMGTGIRGLSGMPYKRHDGIVRPLMDCNREEVLEYLDSIGQAYREDSSNATLIYRRNIIRHRLIPLFEELNPSFRKTTQRTIENLRGAEAFYLSSVEEYRATILSPKKHINIPLLLASPHPATMLYELLNPFGFSSIQCAEIVASLPKLLSGSKFYAQHYGLVRGGDYLELYARGGEGFGPLCIDISSDGEIILPIGRLCWSIKPREEVTTLRCKPSEALFDWHLLTQRSTSLSIRSRREGDKLYPYGIRGSKKLRRIFIDGHFSHEDRRSALLLTLMDEPIWLMGHTADRRYALHESTTCVLTLSLIV